MEIDDLYLRDLADGKPPRHLDEPSEVIQALAGRLLDGPAYLDVVLTEGPGPMSAFVELEDEYGHGVGGPRAEWVDRPPYVVLRIQMRK